MGAWLEQNNILKILEESSFQLLCIYPAEVSFKNEDEQRHSPGKEENLFLEHINYREFFRQKENNDRGQFKNAKENKEKLKEWVSV